MKANLEINRKEGSNRSSQPDQDILKNIFDLCVRKTRGNVRRLADQPKSAAWAIDGNYFNFHEGFFDIGNWTSSFFTGMALIAWRETEDEHFLQQVQRLAPSYADKVFAHHMDTMHDLGFLYSLYSVALYKLTGDRLHREVGLRAADLLMQRFNSTGGFIRAWGRMDTAEFDNMAIIDCMMNLPLLHWAASETGNRSYSNVATQHASTALNCFVRKDDSVYHAYRFDLETGKPLNGDTYGGCEVESEWARGAAWAIYGFALSYKYTKLPEYLDASLRVARNFVSNLDATGIPMWDFRLSSGAEKIRDASAASVAVCGLQEIISQTSGNDFASEAKAHLLTGLCSEEYLNFDPDCFGVQKFGQVGNGIRGGAQNAYTSWGDYFLMEALARELSQFVPWW